MSLHTLIMNLISGITDPSARIDISSTIMFLRDLYIDGRLSDEELRNELREVISTILDYTHPELIGEEKRARVENEVDMFVKAIKFETMRARIVRAGTMRYRTFE